MLGELSCAAAGCDQSPNQSSASMLQAAAVDESSIAPFHDSWANHSKSITGRRKYVCVCVCRVQRAPELVVLSHEFDWPFVYLMLVGHVCVSFFFSFPSQSVYEEQESSIAPFHDSWANHSKSIAGTSRK